MAAVEADAEPAVEAARSAAGLDSTRLTVEVTGLETGERVRVEVRYRSPVVVPSCNGLVDDVDLRCLAHHPRVVDGRADRRPLRGRRQERLRSRSPRLHENNRAVTVVGIQHVRTRETN